jgi:hypothetical protein
MTCQSEFVLMEKTLIFQQSFWQVNMEQRRFNKL